MYVLFLHFVWTSYGTNVIRYNKNEVKLWMKRKINHRKPACASRSIRGKRPASDFSISAVGEGIKINLSNRRVSSRLDWHNRYCTGKVLTLYVSYSYFVLIIQISITRHYHSSSHFWFNAFTQTRFMLSTELSQPYLRYRQQYFFSLLRVAISSSIV